METVGLGYYLEDLPQGRQFRTVGRTVTEPDIVNFINTIGMTEVLFTNTEFLHGDAGFKGRLAPGSLVFCFVEGPARAVGEPGHRPRLPRHGPEDPRARPSPATRSMWSAR